MKNNNTQDRVFRVAFWDIVLNYEMWSVPHANEHPETSIVLLVMWMETDVGSAVNYH